MECKLVELRKMKALTKRGQHKWNDRVNRVPLDVQLRQLGAIGTMLVRPPTDFAILTLVLIDQELMRLASEADPAANVALLNVLSLARLAWWRTT